MAVRLFSIDQPCMDALLDPLALRCEGWVVGSPDDSAIVAVEARVAGHLVAETRWLFEREDVNAVHSLEVGSRTGFTMLGHLADTPAPAAAEMEFRVRHADGTCAPFARRQVRLIATDYRQKPYGVLLQSHATQYRRRDQIYGSGPSQRDPNPATLALLQRYLGPPPSRVLDIGCGLGTYGRPLLAAGYDWLGVEMKPEDCAELVRLGLPHRRVDGVALPFNSDAFQVAMCVEVLEHIDDPVSFLAETRRVAPRLLVSVPNIELISYFAPHQAVPWHMLEGDHKNFFTRWGLRGLLSEFYSQVEVISYNATPLRTVEGTPLDYHLFAMASV